MSDRDRPAPPGAEDAPDRDSASGRRSAPGGDGAPDQKTASRGDGAPDQETASRGDGAPDRKTASSGDGAPARESSDEGGQHPEQEPDVLGQLGIDLTKLAEAEGSFHEDLWSDQTRRVLEVLGKRERHAAALVGPNGVGKRGLVFALAWKLLDERTPRQLRGRRLIELPFHRVLAGVRQQGDFEKIVFLALRQAAAREDVVLFLDNFTSFIGVSGSGQALLDASYAVETALHQPGLYLLASCTPELHRVATSRLTWLERAMTAVEVPEPPRHVTISVLERAAEALAGFHGVRIGREAIEAAVDLSGYFVKERVLPGKAMELLDEASSKAVLRGVGEGGAVAVSDVTEALSEWVDIPPEKLGGAINGELLELENVLQRRVKGQTSCIRKIADVIRVSRLGLDARPQRPDGVFLFVGPPGVGKSELARALADELYGGSSRFFEFNMTRYSDDDGAARLFGLSFGDVEHVGDLTRVVERWPHSVIVFEQIERTHRDVAVALMQIFRDGYVVDGQGRLIEFSDTVIIMTSNSENLLPSDEENGAVGFSPVSQDREDRYLREVRAAVRKFFPTEFLEGIDEVLTFDPLSDAALHEIVHLHLDDVRERLAERDVTLDVTEEAVARVAEKGASREYGARHLGRTVEGLVLKPVARFLLANQQASAVRVHVVEGDIEVCEATPGKEA